MLVMLLLAGCQTDHDASSPDGGAAEEGLTAKSAASVAADLTTQVAPFLPPGSTLAFVPDDKDGLSLAFRDHLTRAGFSVGSGKAPGGGPLKETIPLRIWSTRSGGDIMVRLSTPSHRLSRIYRDSGEGAIQGSETPSSGAQTAGPLVVETIDPGAHP